MDDIGRYQYVSSFYGPGTICCWLLAFLAVILSWTLNPDLRDRDIIADENFIPMLAIPSVAAIHGMYQLLRFPGGPKTLLTGLDTETLKYSSAFEASVTVCKTYLWVFLGLVILLSFKRGNIIKRLMCLLVVGSLCYTVKATINVTLKREFLKNNFVRPQMMSAGGQTTITMLISCLIPLAWTIFQPRPIRYSLGIGIFLGILFVHLPFLNELVQPNIIIAELKSLAAIRPGDIFPKTNASLQDLDQLVPFGIGFILFALSIRKNLQARAQQQAALNLIELEQAL